MKSVQKHILRNKNGDEVLLINLGAGIASLRINMPEGPREIVLGQAQIGFGQAQIQEPKSQKTLFSSTKIARAFQKQGFHQFTPFNICCILTTV